MSDLGKISNSKDKVIISFKIFPLIIHSNGGTNELSYEIMDEIRKSMSVCLDNSNDSIDSLFNLLSDNVSKNSKILDIAVKCKSLPLRSPLSLKFRVLGILRDSLRKVKSMSDEEMKSYEKSDITDLFKKCSSKSEENEMNNEDCSIKKLPSVSVGSLLGSICISQICYDFTETDFETY